ncbi:MAG: gamma-butyrobetaine hydroxylase-like domain-containing protein [Phycisphaerales bacterium JB043]
MPTPTSLDLEKTSGLTITWDNGDESFYPIAYLRRMSPSADARETRKQLESNPLTVLPSAGSTGPLHATDAELVGNYALRIRFSDGHRTGLYTWEYLRQIAPDD